jgi:hypothetical protein
MRSRSVAFRDEFLDVEGDLGEHLGDECARQDAPQDVEGQCAVDSPGRIGLEMALGGAPSGERGEVVAHGLGAEVLPGVRHQLSGFTKLLHPPVESAPTSGHRNGEDPCRRHRLTTPSPLDAGGNSRDSAS